MKSSKDNPPLSLKLKVFSFGDIIVIAVILTVAFLSWKNTDRQRGRKSAVVSVNGKTYGKWPLPLKPETLSVKGAFEIELNSEGVRVIKSNCPRQICVKQGTIHKAGQSIVCVPNKIVISIVSEHDSIDAVVQ